MDSILLLSPEEEKLSKFLTKLGYGVLQPKKSDPIKDLLDRPFLDLVIVDSSFGIDTLDFVKYVRSNETTRKIPMVVVTSDAALQVELKQEHRNDGVLTLPAPAQIGKLAATIATELRLRKFVGSDNPTATLAEANAALRDLNSRFRKELEQARGIQQGLLPKKLPANDIYEIAVQYQPLEEVGGDWYFVREFEDRKISFQVADVTGHGLAAAFIGSMTKLALTAASGRGIAEEVTEMNRLMAPQLPQGTFVTMCSCLYDPVGGDVSVVRAGHPPALVVKRSESKVLRLGGNGFALGFFDDSTYEQEKTNLSSNDLVVIYSDGITEAQNRDGEVYGMDRFSDFLLSTNPLDNAQQIIDATLVEFKRFCDGRLLKDDVTLAILKRK